MPKKTKKGKKKGKGKKKAKKTVEKKEETPQEPETSIPEGNDWIIMSLCLCPWEAKNITMFLNFEGLMRASMTFKSLRRVIEDKIGSVSRLTFYLNPPKKEEPLELEQYAHFRLSDINCKGGPYVEPERCILFFDFDPAYPTGDIDIGIDPLLLAEPSQTLLNYYSEKVKQDASSLFKMIGIKPKKQKVKKQIIVRQSQLESTTEDNENDGDSENDGDDNEEDTTTDNDNDD